MLSGRLPARAQQTSFRISRVTAVTVQSPHNPLIHTALITAVADSTQCFCLHLLSPSPSSMQAPVHRVRHSTSHLCLSELNSTPDPPTFHVCSSACSASAAPPTLHIPDLASVPPPPYNARLYHSQLLSPWRSLAAVRHAPPPLVSPTRAANSPHIRLQPSLACHFPSLSALSTRPTA